MGRLGSAVRVEPVDQRLSWPAVTCGENEFPVKTYIYNIYCKILQEIMRSHIFYTVVENDNHIKLKCFETTIHGGTGQGFKTKVRQLGCSILFGTGHGYGSQKQEV